MGVLFTRGPRFSSRGSLTPGENVHNVRSHRHRRWPQRPRDRRLPGPRRRQGAGARAPRSSSAAPASPRSSGPATRSPPQHTSTACSAPRSSATSSSSGTVSRCCRGTRPRSRPSRMAARSCWAPTRRMTHREVSKFSAKDADALPKYEAMLERVADFLEPTLMQTPPNPWSFRPPEPDPTGQARARIRQARPRRPESRRDPHRGGDSDPRPLVRVGAAQGHPRDRRHHRRHGLALDAGDGLRAVPPRDGRVRRRPGCVGLRARRHGRDQQRDRLRGRARAGRRDPDQRRGGAASW